MTTVPFITKSYSAFLHVYTKTLSKTVTRCHVWSSKGPLWNGRRFKYSFILKYCLWKTLSFLCSCKPVHFQQSHLCGYNMLILPYPFHSDICPAAKELKAKIQMPPQHSAKYWFTVTHVTYVDTLNTTYHFSEITADTGNTLCWLVSFWMQMVHFFKILDGAVKEKVTVCECACIVRVCVCVFVSMSVYSKHTSLCVDLRVWNKQ